MRYALRDDLQFRARLSSRLSNTQDELSFPIQSYNRQFRQLPCRNHQRSTSSQLQWDVNPTIRITGRPISGSLFAFGWLSSPKAWTDIILPILVSPHTDGIWVRWNMNRNWRLDGIISYSPDEGSSHAARATIDPLPNPHHTSPTFANLAHRNTSGLWVQRELSVSVYPPIVSTEPDPGIIFSIITGPSHAQITDSRFNG